MIRRRLLEVNCLAADAGLAVKRPPCRKTKMTAAVLLAPAAAAPANPSFRDSYLNKQCFKFSRIFLERYSAKKTLLSARSDSGQTD
jgi:hypothetical protein